MITFTYLKSQNVFPLRAYFDNCDRNMPFSTGQEKDVSKMSIFYLILEKLCIKSTITLVARRMHLLFKLD